MKKVFTLMIALLSIFGAANAADVVFNVVVPNDPTQPKTHMTNSVWIVGNFNGWNNNEKQLSKVDDTHYTITMDDATWVIDNGVQVTTANVQYKYLSGPDDWGYVEKLADGGEKHANRVYTGENTWVDPTDPTKTETSIGTQGKDTVVRWALTWKPVVPIPMQVTIDAFVPLDVLQLYIVGTFNGWKIPTDTTQMTLKETTAEGKVYTISFFSTDVNKLQYKFCAGPAWDYEQTTGNFIYPDVTQNTAIEVVTEFKKYFDPSKTGNINITATVPAGTERAWIMGSHLGWDWTKLQEGTRNDDGTFSFVATNVMSIEYRLYNWNTEFTHPEAKDGEPTVERPNRTATYPDDANISITVSAWRNVAPSALKELNADKYKIYTSGKKVVVEGVTTKAELFDISGRIITSKVLSGTFKSETLKSGLYIIKVDGQAQKISVK
ncbi:MAG: T9SS type A sorting domain-containing protein, partial [Paludibacter sp.]